MAYVAYYNEKSLLVTHPLLTVSRYLKHAFLLDIISVFPFEEVVRLYIELIKKSSKLEITFDYNLLLLQFRIVNDNTDMDLYRLNRMLLVS